MDEEEKEEKEEEEEEEAVKDSSPKIMYGPLSLR